MIPSSLANAAFLGVQPVEMPTYTYHFDLESERVRGFVDGREAMKQAIYKIIFTERYKYIIYSRNYGSELEGLIGQPIPYVLPEIKRRVTEALVQDDRITSTQDWDFTVKGGEVLAAFTANTTFGDVDGLTFKVVI